MTESALLPAMCYVFIRSLTCECLALPLGSLVLLVTLGTRDAMTKSSPVGNYNGNMLQNHLCAELLNMPGDSHKM